LKCRFFTYGNFPLEQHLKQIHEEALIKFERIESNTDIPKQKLWEKPVSKKKNLKKSKKTKRNSAHPVLELQKLNTTGECFSPACWSYFVCLEVCLCVNELKYSYFC